ncbi:SDR family NAD(P)-dependent oxidoreductase [Rhabdothermincola salaria]|uniref:SDR family NAD(P)-dependent oxidoreductase n=1 Tax=Rhabdothermincola salaria TaxID=2903142 RepID=UPI001E427373|nr:SDR family oxidoreductase [Rhabdothermincola salaria]
MTGVALVTGASRGIGRAAALALARAGFDVAVSARTLREGEGRVEPDSVHGGESVAVEGSLERTASEIEASGRRALPVAMDFCDLASVEAAVATVLAAWGRVDVLVNNGLYRGPGTMDRLADLRMDDLDHLMRGNFAYQIRLVQLVLPGMLERGHGRIVDMVSGSARHDPPGPAGEGGWGIAYAASKAALGRVAGGVNAEYAPRGVWAFNVDPGNVVTERRRALHPDQDFTDGFGADSPEATAETIAWLASSPDAERFLGRWVFAPKLAEDLARRS